MVLGYFYSNFEKRMSLREEVVSKFGPGTLFVIARSNSSSVIVYKHHRKGSVLEGPMVSYHYRNLEKPEEKAPVSREEMDHVFGFRVRKVGVGKYELVIRAVADRTIRLSLTSSGKVVPKIVIDGKECRLRRVLVDEASSPVTMVVFGTRNKREVQETIPIPRAIVNKMVNIAGGQLLRSFFSWKI